MAKKVTYWVLSLFLFASNGSSQTPPKNIYPLVSTRAQVAKLLGTGKRDGDNREIFELPNESVRITYYSGGCDRSEEKHLNISKDSVVEVKIVPKKPVQVDDTISNWYAFEPNLIPGNRWLRYDPQDGILVLSTKLNTEEQMLENTDEIYFLPPDSKLSGCIANSFDGNSALAILNYYDVKKTEGDKFDYPPLTSGIFFPEDSEESKVSAVKDFAEKLLEHKNSYGYVVMHQKEEETTLSMDRRRRWLLDNIQKQGIVCSRLIFVDTKGPGGSGSTALYIVHKTFVMKEQLMESGNSCM